MDEIVIKMTLAQLQYIYGALETSPLRYVDVAPVLAMLKAQGDAHFAAKEEKPNGPLSAST